MIAIGGFMTIVFLSFANQHPLHYAAQSGNIEAARTARHDWDRWLLPLNIGELGPKPVTPLDLAAIHGSMDILRFAFEQATPLQLDNYRQSNNELLLWAAKYNQHRAISYLLSVGFSANRISVSGESAITVAAEIGRAHV